MDYMYWLENEFFKAIFDHDLSLIRKLISQGADINQYDSNGTSTPLQKAVELDKTDVVTILLAAGADPNQLCQDEEYTPLTLAVKAGNTRLAQMLLESGANPSYGGLAGSALEIAAEKGHVSLVRDLITFGANVNPNFDGIESSAEVLVDEEVNQRVAWTPLMTAALMGHLSVIEVLIEAGADPNVVDDEGETALVKAARQGHQFVCNYLFPLTSDIEQRKFAEQELMHAIQRNRRKP